MSNDVDCVIETVSVNVFADFVIKHLPKKI